MNNLNLLPSIVAFTEVAKSGSFTAAAKSLGLSKAAVSLQVKRLETYLGQALITRNTRRLSLTAVGHSLLARSEQLQVQVNSALDELDLAKDSPSGRFAITIPHTFEADIVLPAIRQLCLEYPRIEPHIHVSDDTHDLIQNDFDVAIHGGAMKDSAYKAQLVGRASEVFCASPGFLASNSLPKNLEGMLSERFIAAPWQKSALQIRERRDTKMSVYSMQFVASSNNFASTLEMVKSGMGIGLLPEFTLRESIAKGQLQLVLPEYQGREWPFYFVHRFTSEKPIHIVRFFQLVKHNFLKATTK